MSFTFNCPFCGNKIEIHDDRIGQTADCPFCKRKIPKESVSNMKDGSPGRREMNGQSKEASRKFDVFISYRRKGGFETAKLVYYSLQQKGYRVFMDVEALRSGPFNKQLYDVIDSVSDFVLILSKDALERCKNEGDWVREEIVRALRSDKNIIPVIQNDFTFPENMPPEMDGLEYYNGVTASVDYFDAAMDKLETMLKSKPYSRKNEADTDFLGLMKIIKIMLRTRDFKSAKTYCQEALKTYKDRSILYVYQLLAEAGMRDESELYLYAGELCSNSTFLLAMEFADESEKADLGKIITRQDELCDELKNVTNCVCDFLTKRIDEINNRIHLFASPQLNLKLYGFMQQTIPEPQYVSLEVTYPEREPLRYATTEFLMTNSFSIKAWLTIHDNYCNFSSKSICSKIADVILDVLSSGNGELNDIPVENVPFILEKFGENNPCGQPSRQLKFSWRSVNAGNALSTPDGSTAAVPLTVAGFHFLVS